MIDIRKLASAAAIAGLLGALPVAAAAQTPTLLAPTDLTLTLAEVQELTLGVQPPAWFAERLTGAPDVAEGVALNPKIQFMLQGGRGGDPVAAAEQEQRAFATSEGRAAIRASADRRWTMRTAVTPEMASVDDRQIASRGGDLHVRVYRPETEATGPLPVLVYYHGGGFVFASVAAVDRLVRLIANEAKVIVVSVDYRLAPEHPYPAPHDDAEDAFVWARANAAAFGGDPERVAVGGDSAGGHLAAVTSARQVTAGRPAPLYQLLYYPAVTLEQDDPSYDQFDADFGLDRSFMEAVTAMAFPGASRDAPEAHPVDAPSLAGLPASIVVTAGFDPLRDQARRYARRLEADGVSVLYLNYPTLTHSFLNWSGVIEDADEAARETARTFGRAIRSRAAVLALPDRAAAQ
jgi:acetyl esterase